MNLAILDDVVRVDDKECFLMTRDLTRLEGLFVGGSGGAAVAGALKVARYSPIGESRSRRTGRPTPGFWCFSRDAGHKYLSKIFNDDWMRENGFLDDSPGLGTVRDVLSSREKRPLVTAEPGDTLREVIDRLKTLGISQLPVVQNGKLRGIVGRWTSCARWSPAAGRPKRPSADLIENDYATVTRNTEN